VQVPETSAIAPRTETEATLARIWCELLNVQQIGVEQTFVSLGGDSLLALRMIAQARRAGVGITPRLLFEYPTIEDLAAHAERLAPDQPAMPPIASSGSGRLTPAQAWFFEGQLPRPNHYNQAILLEVAEPLNLSLLEQAVQAVCGRHEALGLRLQQTPDGWRQQRAPVDGRALVSLLDTRPLPAALREELIRKAIDGLNAGLDIRQGPLCKLAYIRRPAGDGDLLYWTAHHLVVDAVSWRVLIEELAASYGALRGSAPAALPPPGPGLTAWADHLAELAASPGVEQQRPFWQALLAQECPPLPLQSTSPPVQAAREEIEWLDKSTTEALLGGAAARGHSLQAVLVAALAWTLSLWGGAPRVRIDCEGHGRGSRFASLDITRSIGWFTSLYPVVFELPQGVDTGTAVARLASQLERIPDGGFGYGLLRYLSSRPLREQSCGQVLFNFLGRLDAGLELGPFRLSDGRAGQTRHPDNAPYALELDAELTVGGLRLEWRFAPSTDPAVVSDLLRLYRAVRQDVSDAPRAGA
jgi:non-ribosomal peptide synthase protein (TIGR01720 family)